MDLFTKVRALFALLANGGLECGELVLHLVEFTLLLDLDVLGRCGYGGFAG